MKSRRMVASEMNYPAVTVMCLLASRLTHRLVVKLCEAKCKRKAGRWCRIHFPRMQRGNRPHQPSRATSDGDEVDALFRACISDLKRSRVLIDDYAGKESARRSGGVGLSFLSVPDTPQPMKDDRDLEKRKGLSGTEDFSAPSRAPQGKRSISAGGSTTDTLGSQVKALLTAWHRAAATLDVLVKMGAVLRNLHREGCAAATSTSSSASASSAAAATTRAKKWKRVLPQFLDNLVAVLSPSPGVSTQLSMEDERLVALVSRFAFQCVFLHLAAAMPSESERRAVPWASWVVALHQITCAALRGSRVAASSTTTGVGAGVLSQGCVGAAVLTDLLELCQASGNEDPIVTGDQPKALDASSAVGVEEGPATAATGSLHLRDVSLSLPFAGFASVVRLIALHGDATTREVLLFESTGLRQFARSVRRIFLHDDSSLIHRGGSDVGVVEASSATGQAQRACRVLHFLLASCRSVEGDEALCRAGGGVAGRNDVMLLLSEAAKELWSRFLSALELSCLGGAAGHRESGQPAGGGVDAASGGGGLGGLRPRPGLAKFVYCNIYLPLTGGTQTSSPTETDDDAAGDAAQSRLQRQFSWTTMRSWDDMTTRTALYRILRLVGDLGEAELQRANSARGTERVAAAASGDATTSGAAASASTADVQPQREEDRLDQEPPPPQSSELQRKRYKALLAQTNGVLTIPIVRQIAEDQGILVEETTQRSPHGHVLFRLFRPSSSQVLLEGSDKSKGNAGRGGRLDQSRQAATREQLWFYAERGCLYVKDAVGFRVATSIENFLAPFR